MSESKPMSIPEVKKLLKRNKKKAVLQTIENCLIVLRNDPTLQGAIRQNILTDRQDIVKDVGWVRSSTTITDTDYQYIMHYLECNYCLNSEKKIQAAIKIIANENQFHPIQDYLSALRWDRGTVALCTEQIPGSRTLCLHHGSAESVHVRCRFPGISAGYQVRLHDVSGRRPGCRQVYFLPLSGTEG